MAWGAVTLERQSDDGPTHNAPTIVNVRHFPRLEAGRHEQPAVHESRVRAKRDVVEEDPAVDAPDVDPQLAAVERLHCSNRIDAPLRGLGIVAVGVELD